MNPIIIAIDGYSSTGKSTLAKALASVLGYTYIDSGAMYRAVTLYALRCGYVNDSVIKVDQLVTKLPCTYKLMLTRRTFVHSPNPIV